MIIETFSVIGLLTALTAPVAVFLTSWNQSRSYSEEIAEEITDVLANDAQFAVLVGSVNEAEKLIANTLKFPGIIGASIVEANGNTLARKTVRDADSFQRNYQVVRDIQVEQLDSTAVASAVAGTPERIGTVTVTLSLERLYQSSIHTAYEVALIILLVTIVQGIAIVRLWKRVLKPLSRLASFVEIEKDMSASTPRLARQSPAEVHAISSAVDAMRQRICEHQRERSVYAGELEKMIETRTRALVCARDEAQSANRAKTLFLANVSHELRTPLQAIICFATMGEDDAREQGLDPIASILTASSTLLELIEQLLVLSRAEAESAITLSLSTFSLSAFVREVAATLRPTLSGRNAFIVECPTTDVLVYSDRTRIREVIFNLVRNADKFTAEGRIVLALSSEGNARVCLSVSDEGVGVATEELERIFAPFYQGKQPGKDGFSSGIGIGLWLSRQIAEALGGKLQVSSEPGVGSTFRLCIPIGDPRPSTGRLPLGGDSVESAASLSVLKGARVLLAEDEELIRLPLRAVLQQHDVLVEEVGTGDAALEAILQSGGDYDALILDHRMPGIQGIDILSQCRRELDVLVPAIILTADENPKLFAEVTALGADLLVKPTLPETLLETLAALIMRHGAKERVRGR